MIQRGKRRRNSELRCFPVDPGVNKSGVAQTYTDGHNCV
jgi:hypothetical protein